ncbi:MAG: hypothetical protein SGI71_09330 [Verrucomicrobiota bacterium]|nr:hypothetical protein [Verrucomicrobiota bacterium]
MKLFKSSILVSVVAVLGFTGCAQKTTTTTTAETKADQKAEEKVESKESTYVQNQREEIKKMEEERVALKKEIDAKNAALTETNRTASVDSKTSVSTFEERKELAEKKLKDLESSSGEAADRLKQEANQAMDDLKKAFTEVKDKAI